MAIFKITNTHYRLDCLVKIFLFFANDKNRRGDTSVSGLKPWPTVKQLILLKHNMTQTNYTEG